MLNLDVFERVGPSMANRNNNKKYGMYTVYLFSSLHSTSGGYYTGSTLTKTKIKRQDDDDYGRGVSKWRKGWGF